MGKFFTIAGLLVLLSIVVPVIFLSRQQPDQYEGKAVLYNSFPDKIKTIDPATSGDTLSAALQANFYEPLYTYHYLKRPVEVIPLLAETMPDISADGLTYTIRIKKGINYARNGCFGFEADGRPKTRGVRAQDFVLAFQRIADTHLQTPQSWSFISGKIVGLDEYREKTQSYKEGDFSRYELPVEGIRALDDYTLQFKLKMPFPALIYVLASANYSPIPPEVIHYYLESLPFSERIAQITKMEQAVGTGPYTLTTFERGGRIILERNREYHHGTYPTEGTPEDEAAGLLKDAGKPVPFIDVLHYEVISEELPMWLGFLSRQSDVSGIPRDAFAQVITVGQELTDQWKKKGIRLITYDDPSVYWLGFNMEDPVIRSSKSLRQALWLAMDVETYIKVLFNGRGKRAVNTLPSSFPVYEEAGPSPYAHYDPKAAKTKLEDARREIASVGKLDSNGQIPTLILDVGGQDESARRQAEFIKQQFQAVGVQIKIQLNDWPTLLQKVHNKQVQIYTMGWHADYPDPENFLQLYYGPNIEIGTNNTNYKNPEFDALYRKISVMSDSPERRTICAQMVKILNEDCPVLLLSEPRAFLLFYDWVSNYKRHPIGYGMIKYVKLDTSLRRQMGGR